MQQTPLGNAYEIDLKIGLNTDTAEKDIKPIGQTATHIANNGIERDGGVTNVYETTADETAYDFVFHASNGKRVQIKNNAPNAGVYVDGVQVLSTTEMRPRYKIKKVEPKVSGVRIFPVLDVIENYVLGVVNNVVGVYSINDNMEATLLFQNSTWANSPTVKYCLIIPPSSGVPVYYATFSQNDTTTGELRIWSSTTSWVAGAAITTDSVQSLQGNNVGTAIMVCLTAKTPTGGPTSANNLFLGTFGGAAATRHKGSYVSVLSTTGTPTIFVTWDPSTGFADSNQYATVNSTLTTYTPVAGPGGNSVGGFAGPGFVHKRYAASARLSRLTDGLAAIPANVTFSTSITTPPDFFIVHRLDQNRQLATNLMVINGVVSHGFDYPVGTANRNTGQQNNNGDGNFYYIVPDTENETVYEIAPGIVKVPEPQGVSTFSRGVLYIDTSTLQVTRLQPMQSLTYRYNDTSNINVAVTATAGTTRLAGNTNFGSFGVLDTGEKILDFVLDTNTGLIGNSTDVYIENQYRFTGFPSGVEPYKLGTLYVQDFRIPFSALETLDKARVRQSGKTILKSTNYDGYQLENIFNEDLQFFQLFGQFYAFDGAQIWLLPTSNDVASGPLQRVAPAQGLSLLAVSPEAAFFLSNFDNSVFTFNGGRSLQKFARLNKKARIEYGAYNVEENALHLITTNSLLILRDGISTENVRPYANGNIKLYSTVNGIIYGQGAKWKSLQYRSDVFSAGTTAVVPLDLQTAYTGPMDNQYMKTPQYMLYLQRPAGAGTMDIVITYHWIDADTSGSETKTVSLAAGNFDPDGYTRVRYMPTKDSVLGGSLQIQCDQKVIILDVVQYYTIQGPAQVADSQTAVPGT